MGRVCLVDHTADVGLLIEAADLDDLFATAARGLVGYVIANPESIAAREAVSIAVGADSLSDLLVAWLNELVFLIETTRNVYRTFSVQVDASAFRLTARIEGEPLDPHRHELDHEVKAVTHHEARVVRVAERWIGEVILDI
jgi:SHS2 domain-containing protein